MGTIIVDPQIIVAIDKVVRCLLSREKFHKKNN